MESLISFKGNREGIYIHIKDGDFKSIKKQLKDKLDDCGSFFSGCNVVNLKGKELSSKEKVELKNIIENKYGIAVEDKRILEDKINNNSDEYVKYEYFKGIKEGETKFIRSTVRSGQSIKYEGNLIVIGDVNPGGEIIAKGNIVVMGSLKGLAHAGSDGNRDAIVVAFDLQPTQLRIADIIARKPDDDSYFATSKWPEIAKVHDKSLLIEPYLPKK